MKMKTTTFLLVLLLLILIYSVLFFTTVKVKKEIANLNAEIEQIQTQNQKLEAIYLQLQDPIRIEKIAREKLKMSEVKRFYVVEIPAK
jgi:cell division protein FtsL